MNLIRDISGTGLDEDGILSPNEKKRASTIAKNAAAAAQAKAEAETRKGGPNDMGPKTRRTGSSMGTGPHKSVNKVFTS